jgi:enoyl-CoA hydratase
MMELIWRFDERCVNVEVSSIMQLTRSTAMASRHTDSATVTVDRDGHVLLMGLNRPHKRNAFTLAMLRDLSHAYSLLESDENLRCGVLYAHGEHFTGGLDMVDVGPAVLAGEDPYPPDGRDPWRLDGDWSKPVVAAAHGWVMTLGIELLLAADIRVATRDARFSQLEIRRGIYPFGGATLRFPRETGWGNAMRWILTGDEFGAEEAHRMGLIQELADEKEEALQRAVHIAHTIADQAAPLGVQTTLSSAHRARHDGDAAAIAKLRPDIARLFASADGVEGIQSFIERRDAVFTGR